jgi:hypothetical protein
VASTDPLPNADDTITYRLKHPMRPIKGSEHTDPETLKLRPVYVGDLRAIDKDGLGSTDVTCILISRLSGLDSEDADRLHCADFQAIAGVIAARLGKETGLSEMLSALASRPTGEIA